MKTRAILLVLSLLAACSFGVYTIVKTGAVSAPSQPALPKRILTYQPQKSVDTGGFEAILASLQPAKDPTSLESIRDTFADLDRRGIAEIDKRLALNELPVENKPELFLSKAGLFMYGGIPLRPTTSFSKLALWWNRPTAWPKNGSTPSSSFRVSLAYGAARSKIASNVGAKAPASSRFRPRRSTQADRLAPGYPAFHGVSRAIPGRRGHSLAAQRGPHDARRISG